MSNLGENKAAVSGSTDEPATNNETLENKQSEQTNRLLGADKIRRMLVIEAIMYVLLVVCALVTPLRNMAGAVSVPWTVVPVVLMIIAFLMHVPLSKDKPGLVIAGLGAVLSLAIALVQSSGQLFFPAQSESDHIGFYPQEAWAAGAVGLLVALVIVSFARQMVRSPRTRLIHWLSHSLLLAVAAISGAGWCYLPDFFAALTNRTFDWLSALAIVVVLAFVIVLGYASVRWVSDTPAKQPNTAPWVGLAMMPILMTGPVVAIVSVALL